MRSPILPQTESQRRRLSLRPSGQVSYRLVKRELSVALSAVWAVAMVLSGVLVFSQTTSAQAPATQAQTNPAHTNPAPAPAAAPAHKHIHPHKKPVAAVTPAPQPPPPVPVAPPPPDWPKDHPPSAATVVFDSRGLFIVASNSSLSQILKDVSIDTGAKVEGLDSGDQRIFGTYGPGPARDVLSQLLDGSGYNVMLIGDRGQGTPRRILLSPQAGSAAAQNAANKAPASPRNEDTEADQPAPEPEPQAEQEPPQPGPNGAVPPVPVRTPQQIMQEIEQRQEQTRNGQQSPQN